MRRKREELPKEECEKILNDATAGVLSVLGDGGIPHTRVAVLCMEIDHLSGKEAIELVRAHQK